MAAEKSRPDPEFLAMRSIVRTLNKLPRAARPRVLAYALERIRQEPEQQNGSLGSVGYGQTDERRAKFDPLFANAAQAAGQLLG
jgi:hypothetical protein